MRDVMTLRLSAVERAALERGARQRGLPLGVFIREAALQVASSLEQPAPAPVEHEAEREAASFEPARPVVDVDGVAVELPRGARVVDGEVVV